MKIVIKIGGSVIASPLNPELILQYCQVLKSLKAEGHQIVVVVGGGKVAREFISIAGRVGLSDNDKDEIAILVSRLNAQLIARALGDDGSKEIPSTAEQVGRLLAAGKIVVLGGLRPGITTDTVAAIVLKSISSKVLVKATDQDGIYDADPRRFPTARKFDRLSYSDLHKIVSQEGHKPGMHQILDLQSIGILESEKAKVIVINGSNPENISLTIKGRKLGTVVET
nr:UMP kinase [Candidatus Njordarchaeum guaymaensis]